MMIFYQIMNFFVGLILSSVFFWLVRIVIDLTILVLRNKFKPKVILYPVGIIALWLGFAYLILWLFSSLELSSIGFLVGSGLSFFFIVLLYLFQVFYTGGKLDWQHYTLYFRELIKFPAEVSGKEMEIAFAAWRYEDALSTSDWKNRFSQESDKYHHQISNLMKDFEFNKSEKRNLIKALHFFDLDKETISSTLEDYEGFANQKRQEQEWEAFDERIDKSIKKQEKEMEEMKSFLETAYKELEFEEDNE